MKKRLLLAGLLFGTFLTASAQNIQATSFEASEGFTAGQIDGQNGWTVSTDTNNTAISGAEVSGAFASDGSNSLMIMADENFAPSTQGVAFGVFAPTFTSTGGQVVNQFNIYITEDTDEATEGANFAIQTQSNEEQLLTSRLEFAFDKTIAVIDEVNGAAAAYVATTGTWTPNTWHNVAVIYDFAAGTIVYQMDGTTIYSGTAWNATSLDQIVILHDNFPGSTAYIDNMRVFAGTTAGVNNALASKFSVFPNPATSVVNVGGTDALVNNVSIVDLNGRTVKTAKFNGVANAEVNVADLSAGVYMMTVASDKGTVTKKIVKN